MVRVIGRHLDVTIQDYETLPFVDIKDRVYPETSGVYFLLESSLNNRGHNIAYIGEAENIANRIRTHHIHKECDIIGFNYLGLPVYEVEERLVLEKLYMMAYRPPYNREVNPHIRGRSGKKIEIIDEEETLPIACFVCDVCGSVIEEDQTQYDDNILHKPRCCYEEQGGCGRNHSRFTYSRKYTDIHLSNR